ncbi:MAG: hypothetical protein RIQ54_544 [Candidatus Parcubacteria bacterium]|jgi:tyrosyl-tRNA synthetase
MHDFSSLLTRGVDTIIDKDHLLGALSSGKVLRVKFGIDPTGTHIHIGRAVPLWKLRAFQDVGCQIVLIIGDFTAQIGDASDKLSKRPFLNSAQVQENMKGYLEQVGKILDLKACEIHYNSTWLSKLTFREICDLAEVFSVAQMIERRNFKERWERREEISVREFLYPLMQGYDSVVVNADLEIGGTDQLFNLTAGRRIQHFYGKPQQDILTTQMLNGLDGRKMSTSWGNVINIVDTPENQFGKIMSMRDEEIIPYFRLATAVADYDIDSYVHALSTGKNPKDIKEILAFEVVSRYHGTDAASRARAQFLALFRDKQVSRDIPTLSFPQKSCSILEIVLASNVAKSNSDARRLIEQGAVEINAVTHADPRSIIDLRSDDVLKIGKRHFFRIRV